MSVHSNGLGWFGILRLGLVQAALGSIVVVVTSTLNRVMVVEYALPAVLPGTLVALHYAVQLIRPRFGHASDAGARRTPWIVGGMAVLGCGGLFCAVASVQIASSPVLGVTLAAVAYALVGLGVGAVGTSLLVLLSARVDGSRRAAAATIVWIMMIAGFAVTSTAVGHALDPFTAKRLVAVTAVVAAAAWLVTVLALWNVEASPSATRAAADGVAPAESLATATFDRRASPPRAHRPIAFKIALRGVWAEPDVRRFTLFVFISMLAYSAQELLLEPFAGLVFGYSLGASAKLSGLWHAAALVGMIGIGVACSGTRRLGSLRGWTVVGCVGSALALSSLAILAFTDSGSALRLSVIALGIANGTFAVAAVGSMMELAHGRAADNSGACNWDAAAIGGAAENNGVPGDAGVRLGLWGAAQAIAFACGGLLATFLVDSVRYLLGSSAAFAVVFAVEAMLFLAAAHFAARTARALPHLSLTAGGVP